MTVLSFIALALLLTTSIRGNSILDVISKGRISGGTVVDSSLTFPFMACLVGFNSDTGYHTGTGTIISNYYILTSASFTFE